MESLCGTDNRVFSAQGAERSSMAPIAEPHFAPTKGAPEKGDADV